jgi:hypothetical protein
MNISRKEVRLTLFLWNIYLEKSVQPHFHDSFVQINQDNPIFTSILFKECLPQYFHEYFTQKSLFNPISWKFSQRSLVNSVFMRILRIEIWSTMFSWTFYVRKSDERSFHEYFTPRSLLTHNLMKIMHGEVWPTLFSWIFYAEKSGQHCFHEKFTYRSLVNPILMKILRSEVWFIPLIDPALRDIKVIVLFARRVIPYWVNNQAILRLYYSLLLHTQK